MMAKEPTFEISTLRWGRVFKTKNRIKALDQFDELAQTYPTTRIYLQVWSGHKLVSEHVANKEQQT